MIEWIKKIYIKFQKQNKEIEDSENLYKAIMELEKKPVTKPTVKLETNAAEKIANIITESIKTF